MPTSFGGEQGSLDSAKKGRGDIYAVFAICSPTIPSNTQLVKPKGEKLTENEDFEGAGRFVEPSRVNPARWELARVK